MQKSDLSYYNAAFSMVHEPQHFEFLFSKREDFAALFRHKNIRGFDELVGQMFPYIKEKHIDYLSFVEDDVVKLYQLSCLKKDKLLAPEYFAYLRLKVKQLLSPRQSTIDLSHIKAEANGFVEELKANLLTYRSKRLQEVGGELKTHTGTKEERLIAFKALDAASKNGENAFADLLKAIASQKANIGLDEGEHSRTGLQQYTRKFMKNAISVQSQLTQLYVDYMRNENTIGEALLDDFFFSNLTPKQLKDIADKYPDKYTRIISTYRPDSLPAPAAQQPMTSTSNGESPANVSKSTPKPSISFNWNSLLRSTPKASISEASTITIPNTTNVSVITTVPPQSPKRPPSRMLLNNITNKPRMTEHKEFVYQLLDCDLHAGLNILKDEADRSRNDIIFMPNSSLNGSNAIEVVEAATEKYPQKICYGILNFDKTHYVSMFAYKSSLNYTQIIILDPKPGKSFQIISKYFSSKTTWKLETQNITQQLNQQDCGICCLQNCADLLYKDIITIQNDKMVLHPEKLTLNARHSAVEIYKKTISEIRNKWEDRLSRVKKWYAFYFHDEPTLPSDYSFPVNKEQQYLREKANELLNSVVARFLSAHSNEIDHLIDQGQNFTKDSYAWTLVTKFANNDNDCKELNILIAKIYEANSQYPSDTYFNNTSIQERLLQVLKDSAPKSFKKVAPTPRPMPRLNNPRPDFGKKALLCLDELIINLKLIPKEQKRFSFSLGKDEVVELLRDCERWRDWFNHDQTPDAIEKQCYYIGNLLFEKTKLVKADFQWDPPSLGKFATLAAAGLLGIDKKEIDRLNTPEKFKANTNADTTIEYPGFLILLSKVKKKVDLRHDTVSDLSKKSSITSASPLAKTFSRNHF